MSIFDDEIIIITQSYLYTKCVGVEKLMPSHNLIMITEELVVFALELHFMYFLYTHNKDNVHLKVHKTINGSKREKVF